MVANAGASGPRNPQRSLSRESVESLCLLHAIGDRCEIVDLPARLGLAASLTKVLAEAIAPLVAQGLVLQSGEVLGVTSAGRSWRDDPTGDGE